MSLNLYYAKKFDYYNIFSYRDESIFQLHTSDLIFK